MAKGCIYKYSIGMVVLILCISRVASAQINGTAMGGIVTVTSEGSNDTTRNPALLGIVANSIINMYATGTAFYDEETNPRMHASDINIQSVQQSNDYYYTFSIVAGYAKPLGKGTIGVSLSSKDNLYLRRKDVQKLSGDVSGISFTQTQTTTTDELTPTVTIAYGWKLFDNNYAGLQIAATPYLSNNDTKTDNSLSPSYSFTLKEYALIIQPAIGYLITDGTSQVGLRFIPSTVKLTKKKVDANFSTGDSSYNDDLKIQQLEGPQINAGGYVQIIPTLGIALEAGFIMPSEYSNTSIQVTDNPSPAIKHQSIEVKNNPILLLKGGTQYTINGSLQIMSGIAFFHLFNNAANSNSKGRGKYNFLLMTLGCNYIYTPDIVITGLLIVSRNSIDTYYHSDDSISLESETKSNVWTITVGAGISYKL